jgi:DNA-binding CsgD family transcriptional regulator
VARGKELPGGTVTFLSSRHAGGSSSPELHEQAVAAALAEHGGVQVERGGGSVLGAFASPAAAVAAAVDLVNGAARGSGMRVGLHTGEATPDVNGYPGRAGEHAALVSAAAAEGQVLLTAATAALVQDSLGRERRLETLGSRALPGLDRPETLFELRLGISSTPVHARERPFLERDGELATVLALARRAEEGDGSLVVIEGSAGIGKTRLLAEVRKSLDDDMRVLLARGGEFEGEFAFGVVRQLFEALLATAAPGVRADLLSGAAALAEPLFDSRALADAPDEGETPFAMFHGLYWLAANLASYLPTVLLIDDLHWADTPSLRWLGYLARRLDGVPLLVVAGMRPPDQGREPELLTELLADPAATAIRPGPLTVEAIAALVRRRFEEEGEPEFCEAVEAATRGNPLFTLTLLDTVAREKLPPRADQAHRLLELGPQVVGRAVALRLARLPADAVALVEAAAILGDGADPHEAGVLAGLDEAATANAARVLLRSDLLIRDDPIEFFHPVVRSAIYEDLDAVARSDGHRRTAGLRIEAGEPHEQAAAHLMLVNRGSDPFVVETLRTAAHRSLSRGAPEAAVAYLTRALEERACDELRGELLAELGIAEGRIDGRASAEHLEQAVELITDPVRRAEVGMECARALWLQSRLREALALSERLRADVDPGEHPDLHERLTHEIVLTGAWEPETYPGTHELMESLDVSRLHGGYGSDLLLATAAMQELRLARDRELGVELARRSLESGRLHVRAVSALHYAGFALIAAGHLDEAIAGYDRAYEEAVRRGDATRLASVLTFRGRFLTMRGDLNRALDDLNEGLELALGHGVLAGLAYLHGFLILAHVERAELAEAQAVLAASGLPEVLPPNAHLNYFRLGRGRLWIETGELDRGVGELLALGEMTKAVPFDNPALFAWRRFAVEGLLRLGRRGEARALADEELELARRWGARHEVGASLRARGLVEGGEGGMRLLEEAVEMYEGTESQLQQARALIDLGAALRRDGRRTRAREVLTRGVDLALRTGVLGLVDRGNEELAASGARPRRSLVTGLDALTPSERRVAELAAGELTNKEIAQTLFVTVKTVEVHLSSVYRKLQLGSRRELAAALAERDAATAA